MTKRAGPKSKSSRASALSPKPKARKRDKLGRYLPKPAPPKRDKLGRFLPAKKTKASKPRPVNRPSQFLVNPFQATRRSLSEQLPRKKPPRKALVRNPLTGQFAPKGTITEPGHFDGRAKDAIRVRSRITFDEALALYEYDVDDYSNLPDWVTYLAGAPS